MFASILRRVQKFLDSVVFLHETKQIGILTLFKIIFCFHTLDLMQHEKLFTIKIKLLSTIQIKFVFGSEFTTFIE